MIVAERKPVEEIRSYIGDARRVLIVGCHGCVTVCGAGGKKEVDLLAGALQLDRRSKGRDIEIGRMTLERQCDPEFLTEMLEQAKDYEAILSMACGAGVQLTAERSGAIKVFPALNTLFIGVNEEKGRWDERCRACGDCKLFLTGGICAVTRCSKGLLNGPCGGSRNGSCEIDPATPCGWQLIIDRLEATGCLDQYETILEPADWSRSREGGPRKLIREDLK
jgi:ferredoxin